MCNVCCDLSHSVCAVHVENETDNSVKSAQVLTWKNWKSPSPCLNEELNPGHIHCIYSPAHLLAGHEPLQICQRDHNQNNSVRMFTDLTRYGLSKTKTDGILVMNGMGWIVLMSVWTAISSVVPERLEDPQLHAWPQGVVPFPHLHACPQRHCRWCSQRCPQCSVHQSVCDLWQGQGFLTGLYSHTVVSLT